MLERFLPTREAITQSRMLRWLGPRLHDPLLWHVNRRSVARGVAMGVFFGLMIPIAQIPAAAIASLLLRGNLLIAAASTLVSNPLTYGPLYYFAYQLGAGVIGHRTPANVENRPGLERKTRSMLNLAMLTALNRPHELKLHVRGALNNGVSQDEIKEVLLQTAIYCGVPAAIDSFRVAAEVVKEAGK